MNSSVEIGQIWYLVYYENPYTRIAVRIIGVEDNCFQSIVIALTHPVYDRAIGQILQANIDRNHSYEWKTKYGWRLDEDADPQWLEEKSHVAA